MKITICGSLSFIEQMLSAKAKLEALGHSVETPPAQVPGEDGQLIPVEEMYAIYKHAGEGDAWVWERRGQATRNHNRKIEEADTVLIMNLKKNGIAGYVGPAVLLEMGLAFYLGKKIYLLEPIADQQAKEELLGMHPTVINGDLNKICS